MDNFFNYVTKPLNTEDVDKWFKVNNIYSERLELYYDFSKSLYELVNDTYLGHNNDANETNIKLTEIDNQKHFEWCWNKVIDGFIKEGITFNKNGEHYDTFKEFFEGVFYGQTDIKIKNSLGDFFSELFNVEKGFTKSDLDFVTSIYKSLDKNLKNN